MSSVRATRVPAAFALLLFTSTLAGAALPALPSTAPGTEGFLVTFEVAPSATERAEILAAGIDAAYYRFLPLATVAASPDEARWLSSRPYVVRIDPDRPAILHLDRSVPLLRVGAAAPPSVVSGDGTGVTVAVLDSGIDPTHPDLAGRVAANVRFLGGRWVDSALDPDGHGTHIAGIVGGDGTASGGRYRGVAPGVRFVGMDFGSAFTTSTAISAFEWIHENREAYGIRVVTNSWGRAQGEAEGYDPMDPVVRATNRLVQDGIVVVFSAGNHGPAARTLSIEAMNPFVITVGATDDAGTLQGYSGRGPTYDARGTDLRDVKPDVVAPGERIVSARSSGAAGRPAQRFLTQLPGATPETARYLELSGTSQAAPHVAGIVALLLAARPDLSPAQVANILREATVDLGQPGPDPEYGFGLVDGAEALRLARGEARADDNVLVAGGVETWSGTGRVVSTGSDLAGSSTSGTAARAEVEFPVKPGASRVDFEFSWTPAAVPFRAFLSDGSQIVGPWRAARVEAGRSVIRGTADGPFATGVWRLVGEPAGPAAAEFAATVEVRVDGDRTLAGTLPPEHRLADDASPPATGLADEVRYRAELARANVPAAGAGLLLIAVMGAALVLARRK